jgi:hypothetical protein
MPSAEEIGSVGSRSGSKARLVRIGVGRRRRFFVPVRELLVLRILSPPLGWFALHGSLLCDLNLLSRRNGSNLLKGRGKQGIRGVNRRQAAEGENNQTRDSHVVLYSRVDQALPRAYGNRRCQRRALTGNGLNGVNLDDQRQGPFRDLVIVKNRIPFSSVIDRGECIVLGRVRDGDQHKFPRIDQIAFDPEFLRSKDDLVRIHRDQGSVTLRYDTANLGFCFGGRLKFPAVSKNAGLERCWDQSIEQLTAER